MSVCNSITNNDLKTFTRLVENSKTNLKERNKKTKFTVLMMTVYKPISWMTMLLKQPDERVGYSSRDPEGNTALMLACKSHDKQEHVKLLLEHPDVHADHFTYDDCRTALWYACKHTDSMDVKLLIASGRLLASTLKGKDVDDLWKIPYEMAEQNTVCPEIFHLLKCYHIDKEQKTTQIRDLLRAEIKPRRFFDVSDEKSTPSERTRQLNELFAEARHYTKDKFAIVNNDTVMVKGQLVSTDDYTHCKHPLRVIQLVNVFAQIFAQTDKMAQ